MKKRDLAQEVLLVCQLVLVVVLLALVVRSVRFRSEARAAESRIQPVDLVVKRATRGSIIVAFPRAMIPVGEIGSWIDSPLRTEPPVRLRARWLSTHELELHTLQQLALAKNYELVWDSTRASEFRDLGGLRVRAKDDLRFAVGAPALLRSVVDATSGRPRLALEFNVNVAASDLEPLLRLERDGKAIACRVSQDPGNPRRCVVDPESSPSRVTMHIDAGLKGVGGDVPTGKPIVRNVAFVGELRWTRLHGNARELRLGFNQRPFSSNAETAKLARSIRLEPAVDFVVEPTWNGLRLAGDFVAGEVYRVRLERGFPGRGRKRLARDTARTVRISDLRPDLRFAQRGSIISRHAEARVELQVTNVRKLGVSLRRVYPNNLVRFSQEPSTSEIYSPALHKTLDIDVPKNRPQRIEIDLEQLFGERPRGVFRLNVIDDAARRWPQSARKLVQFTDLGISARAGRHTIAVAVSSIADASPKADALVTVRTPTNQVLTRGRTNGRGIAMLPFARGPADRKPWLIEVEHSDDHAFVDFQEHRVELSGEALSGREYVGDGIEAWVDLDRRLVRPGGRASACVSVRDAQARAVVGRDLELRWRGPRGRVKKRRALRSDGSGLMLTTLDLPRGAASGTWGIEVFDRSSESIVGSASFRVESFVPDRIDAKLDVAGPLAFGREGRARVRGTWLEGGPVAAAPVELELTYLRGAGSPEAYRDWSFALTRQRSKAPPGQRVHLEAKLDAQGSAELSWANIEAPSGVQRLRAHVAASVLDPSGRAVWATSRVDVVRDVQIGVRASDRAQEVVALKPDGSLDKSKRYVRLRLEEHSWTWGFRVVRGVSRYSSKVERRSLAETVVELRGRARVDLGADKLRARIGSRWLVVAAEVLDRAPQGADSDVGGELVAEQAIGRVPLPPSKLQITAATPSVRPGALARCRVTSPFAGKALVTVESDRVHAAELRDVPEGESEVEVRIPAGLRVPNVYVVATLRAPQASLAFGSPAWSVGATSLAIEHGARGLDFVVRAPTKIQPGQTVTVEVEAPSAKRAIVFCVDEGIRRRTRASDPDPLGFFMAKRRLSARGADSGTNLLERVRYVPKRSSGGGGGVLSERLANATSTTVTVVAMSRLLALDASGRGRVELDLPDEYEGRLRLAVVAANPQAIGAKASDVLVRAPLGLRAALPRMLEPGDRCHAIVSLRNSTGKAGEVVLSARGLEGLRVVGEGERRVELAAGARRDLRMELRAGDTRRAQRLRLHARLGEASRVLTQSVDVRPSLAWSEERLAIDSSQSRLRIPGRWDKLKARLIVSLRPDASLLPALRELEAYPYGCVEQTTSKVRVQLAARGLLRTLDAEAGDVLGDQVRHAIDRLASMICGNGALATWPGSRRPYPFGSLYALDFLVDARKAGFEVDNDLLAGLWRTADRILADDSSSISLRVYALEIATKSERPVRTWIDVLEPLVTRRGDRARLALACARLGLPSEHLLRGGASVDKREGEGMLRSALRERALVLRAMLASPAAAKSGRGAQRLADRLGAALRSPRRLTTQELGEGLRAMLAFYSRLAPPSHGFELSVRVGSRTYKTSGKPIELELNPGDVLEFASTARVFGVLELKGWRFDPPQSAESYASVERRIKSLRSGEATERFAKGEVYEVELRGRAARRLENLLVLERIPGGFEFEALPPGDSKRRLTWRPTSGKLERMYRLRRELRDDRAFFFPTNAVSKGEFVIRYRVRATFAGQYRWPAVQTELLYEPGSQLANAGDRRVEVLR